MKPVIGAAQMRAFEQSLFAAGRADSLTLMERAAAGVAACALERYRPDRVLIVCGSGNNGGDGLAAARLLHEKGVAVQTVLAARRDRLSPDAAVQLRRLEETGCSVAEDGARLPDGTFDCVIDALFGTGLARDISGAYATLIEQINAQPAPVLSIDLPSGVNGDTGRIMGTAVCAEATVTFQWLKYGLLLEPGRSLCGNCTICELFREAPPAEAASLFMREDAARLLPDRAANTHKGDHGRALLCVGSETYTGAALLCAGATLRAGAGLTTAAVPRTVKPAFAALPEACCVPVGDGGSWDAKALEEASALLAGKDAIAIGCGMGMCENESLLLSALRTGKPLVIDADGLNLLARYPEILHGGLHENVVLTPHPAEMARLTGGSVEAVLADPIACARSAAKDWNCVVLLKGASSCIAGGGRIMLNTSGNSGLAKGGSGDVLTGLITGLLAQKTAPLDAASLGAYLLGVSADQALELLKTRMLTAGDVIDAVKATVNTLYSV